MSDYETMQRRRSLVVGIFVILSVIAFFWMVFKFGDLPSFVSEIKSYQVRVQFASAPGVQKDTPVRFCGYQIGTVTEVKPPDVLRDVKTDEFYHQIVVIMSIDNNYKNIPKDVEVKLMTRGLGSSYIELRVPSIDLRREGEFLGEGSLLQGSTGITSEFFPEESQKKLDQLITGIGSFVDSANAIAGDPENQANLKYILANLADASKEATETLKQVREMAAAGKNALQNADGKINQLTSSLVTTCEKLSEVMTHLESVLDKVNKGEGTAGRMVNDGRLYEQLLEDSQQLELVLQDLRTFVAAAKEKGVPIKLK